MAEELKLKKQDIQYVLGLEKEIARLKRENEDMGNFMYERDYAHEYGCVPSQNRTKHANR